MAEKEPIPAHCRDALLEERDRSDRRFIPSGWRVPPQGARGNGLAPPCFPTTPCSSLATSSGVRLQSVREPPSQSGASISPRPYPKIHSPASPGPSHSDAHLVPNPQAVGRLRYPRRL